MTMILRRKARRDGFSLEQPFYTDPDYFKLDMELIWYRDWLFVGHNCELDKPGSYFTVQIGDYPVVLVRDQQGQKIRAFHNSCRHRGSRVCKTDKGTAAKLVCPYHQWTYELDPVLLYQQEVDCSSRSALRKSSINFNMLSDTSLCLYEVRICSGRPRVATDGRFRPELYLPFTARA